MNKTKIEWCDSTWNPVTGCLNGCAYCYARKMVLRFGCTKQITNVFEENVPIKNQTGKTLPYPHGFSPTFYRYKLDELQKWTNPRTIFVCSMADLFGEWIPDEWIRSVFEAAEAAPQHRYLFLTKNPKRYADIQKHGGLPANKNMWYGASITNTELLEQAANAFGDIPFKVNTFFSIEPIMEDITSYKILRMDNFFSVFAKWIIVGAETGNRKEKVVPNKLWIDNICAAAYKVPVFMKDSLTPIVGDKNMRRELPWNN